MRSKLLKSILGVIVVVVVILAASCSSSDTEPAETVGSTQTIGTASDPQPSSESAPAVTDPVATEPSDTGAPGADDALDPIEVVRALSADELNGRNNLTEGSQAARDYLVPILARYAEPAYPEAGGSDGYLQTYDLGTNLVAVVPGTGDLADEFVLIGAHYDHLGSGECDPRGELDDAICNGAADNAAGVAAVLAIVDGLVTGELAGGSTDRRSVVIGLWDGEEDGLEGSEIYVERPAVPLDRTVAYVNFDIQGAALSPALATSTVLVGAETGGPALVDAAARVTSASSLQYATLSLVFGQGRSDHASLASAGVPSVFFTDANNGCYHTVLDDIEHLDSEKLIQQIATAGELFADLVTMQTPPAFVADTPLSTYDDAVEMLEIVGRAEPDFGLLGEAEASTRQFLVDLRAVVDAGADAYDDAAGGVVLGGAATLVGALAASECTGPT